MLKQVQHDILEWSLSHISSLMPNTYFQFQQFRINQEKSGMKVTTDACLFGVWVANQTDEKNSDYILDIGSGTGVLSLMLAQKTTDSQIDAVELNGNAFKEAQDNFHQSPWKDRLNCLNSSIQEYKTEKKYDLIISNPPFFENSFKGTDTSKNQALHSSDLSMEALLENVIRLLSKEGSAYLLYPELEMNRFVALAERSGLFHKRMVIVRNKVGDPVFRKMGKFELKKSNLEESEIIIRKESGKYTDGFWELLKDYYLQYNDPYL